MDYRISIEIYKRTKFNCPLVKIHNETCLLFSEYILASLHITLSSHNLTPALKTHCRQMHLCLGIQETIYLLFITLRYIQAKINEQFYYFNIKLFCCTWMFAASQSDKVEILCLNKAIHSDTFLMHD